MKPWYILQHQGNRKVAKEENIRKSAKTASQITAEEEKGCSMHLQQQQTSCLAARPRLVLAEDAPC
jgi:hypothetical protein